MMEHMSNRVWSNFYDLIIWKNEGSMTREEFIESWGIMQGLYLPPDERLLKNKLLVAE
jgi:hypothetical protein